MGQEDSVDLPERETGLCQPGGRAASGGEDVVESVGLDEGGDPEPGDAGN